MDGVSSAVQEPGGASAGGAKSHSHSELSSVYRHSTGSSPTTVTGSRPKPVIVRQASVQAPYSQIRTGKESLFLPSVESPEEPDNRSTAAVHRPFHTGTGNRNTDDVT